MLNFDSLRLWGGEHLIRNQVRRSVYDLTPSRDLRKGVKRNLKSESGDGGAVDEKDVDERLEEEVMNTIRRAFSLAPTTDPQYLPPQRGSSSDRRPRIETTRGLRQMEVDRWVEGGGCFVRHDSLDGFVMMEPMTRRPTDELGVTGQSIPPGIIGLELIWTKLGVVSSLLHTATNVVSWECKIENTLREAGFTVRMISNVHSDYGL